MDLGPGAALRPDHGRETFGTGAAGGLVLDTRGLSPGFRRPVTFAVIDKMVDLDCEDSLVVIVDHEPAALGYQLELRKETRGRFDFFYDQRLDGAWVALIRRRTR